MKVKYEALKETYTAGCCCNGSSLGSPAVWRRPSSGFGPHPSDPAETKEGNVLWTSRREINIR